MHLQTKVYLLLSSLFFSSAPQCSAGLDIGIVLDKSKSVKIPNLKIIMKFLGHLIEKFIPGSNTDHFGFITFHQVAKLVFSFADSQFHDKDKLLDKMAIEPIKLELQTRTDLALKMAVEKLFADAGRDRPEKPSVMLVLTDGKPTNPDKKYDFAAFAKEISKIFKVIHNNEVRGYTLIKLFIFYVIHYKCIDVIFNLASSCL